MLKVLMGCFYLLVLVVFAFVMVKFISRRMKSTFKPRKSNVGYAAEINPKTAAPQLLKDVYKRQTYIFFKKNNIK